GARYRYRLDGEDFPDPCSRSQPEGVHGPSEVVDPRTFEWHDSGWTPPEREELVIYEAHIGTLTPGGTFGSAIGELPRLADLGITAIELMPVASFPGRWNWGYDAVDIFAPTAVYGRPEGLRRFVDAAHQAGIAVILDVVYNHLGPSGNYTGRYAREYLTARHQTPWGDALNFDDRGCKGVRRFFRENLLHWVHEYHIDGFRFDATNAISDQSDHHILAELAESVHQYPRAGHVPYLFAETDENDVRYLRPLAEGGYGFDGVWADDFHHAVRTILTPGREGYLGSYSGQIDELAATIERGFLYEGQVDPYTNGPRGTPAREQPWRQFVYAIQNHDQIGNQALGLRLGQIASLGDTLAATTLLLLLPATPLIFQGQEFAASTPFLYFTDHEPELGRSITEGRRNEFAAFGAFSDPGMREEIPDPQAESTFQNSVLRAEEANYGAGRITLAYHRELLRLRRDDPVLRASRRGRPPIRTWFADRALVVQVSDGAEGHRWIAVNFGEETRVLVEGPDHEWESVLCSNEARFGGSGHVPRISGGALLIPAHCGALMR
ncbi:MAG: malto-oligosyltrehalose trehalohydrolase, partial [Hyphomicrobiales bacterium]